MTITKGIDRIGRSRSVIASSRRQTLAGVGLLVGLFAGSTLSAASIALIPVDQGSFSRTLTGFSFGLNESITHDASATAVNISNGQIPPSPPVFSQNARLSAGYLMFKIPNLGGSQHITSAVLNLEWNGAAYDYNVNGFSSDPALLQVDYSDSGFPLITSSKNLLNDLIGGPGYASGTTPGSAGLSLSAAAVTEINARRGNLFVVGLFGGDGLSFANASVASSELRLATVPEPASTRWLLSLMLLCGRRRCPAAPLKCCRNG